MFFDYRQNNSGGGFDFDEKRGISVSVIIEADNAQDADRRAENIGLYFDGAGDCRCCGNRWYEAYGDGDPVPSTYGEPIEIGGSFVDDEESFSIKWIKDGPEGFVHYKDGRIEPFGLAAKHV